MSTWILSPSQRQTLLFRNIFVFIAIWRTMPTMQWALNCHKQLQMCLIFLYLLFSLFLFLHCFIFICVKLKQLSFCLLINGLLYKLFGFVLLIIYIIFYLDLDAAKINNSPSLYLWYSPWYPL